MNDLLERYLGAVCTYFFGRKRKKVYYDLKTTIQSLTFQYDDMEEVLIKYGHPRSVAYSYGYRPFLLHKFNKDIVNKVEKRLFLLTSFYLFLSTLYYLYQFNCIPFFTHTVSIDNSTIIGMILNKPFFILGTIFICNLIYLFIADRRNPINQDTDLKWTIEELYQLPHPSQYPKRIVETYLMIGFIIFFCIYGFIFSTPIINEAQHSSYTMIHLMRDFFQPFILIVIFDYVLDLTKDRYTKKYLTNSSLVNLFIFISLTVFIINSSFLKDYLLPMQFHFQYVLINSLILIALIYIYLIVFFKLIRNIKYYRALYKK